MPFKLEFPYKRSLGPVIENVGKHDARAVLYQALCRERTRTARGPCHDRDLAVEPSHDQLSLPLADCGWKIASISVISPSTTRKRSAISTGRSDVVTSRS